MKIENYEEQVYAAALGKVIGVYLGRPFEGWRKRDIEAKWGEITRYVHADQGVPLVVADDDISGAFTFVKILEDCGLLADAPDALYGENWLNYLMEGRTVLWWGGVSHSTEHTAFINLKQGVEAPRSGSIAQNGREVAEQIGAQIFIDAFGMVVPGRPVLAAALARKAAAVSHDGEALHAAVAVAVMVSLGFVIHDIGALLDAAADFIPAGSLIAAVHRDVRAWAARDKDWRKTFARIEGRYGYARYGGNCHVVPNHAVMVMAWAYSGGNFAEAMRIACTAGWDTDCNAANVGSVMALVCGLGRICADYDFRSPFADRMLIPTADGTDSVTDAALIAAKIARAGRRVCGMPPVPPPKGGARHHFSLPGAVHGYQPDAGAAVFWDGGGRLGVRFVAAPGAPASFSTWVHGAEAAGGGAYAAMGAPWLYGGQTVGARLQSGRVGGPVRIRFFVQGLFGARFFSAPAALADDAAFGMRWKAPEDVFPVVKFGFEVSAAAPASGVFFIDSVDFGGRAALSLDAFPPGSDSRHIHGFVSNADMLRGPFSNDAEALSHFGKNEGAGVIATGNRDWTDVDLRCRFAIHAARRAGFVLRYQGLRRHIGVVFTKDSLKIFRRIYGDETVLAEAPFTAPENTPFAVALSARRRTVSVEAAAPGAATPLRLRARDDALSCGGAGFFIEQGVAGFSALSVDALVRPSSAAARMHAVRWRRARVL